MHPHHHPSLWETYLVPSASVGITNNKANQLKTINIKQQVNITND